MWNTDTVYLQTKTETDTYGSIKVTWAEGLPVLCDLQPMGKEKAHKEYGLTDANRYYGVYAPGGAGFIEGHQVKYNNKQYLVRLVQSWAKQGRSNHTFAILSEVV